MLTELLPVPREPSEIDSQEILIIPWREALTGPSNWIEFLENSDPNPVRTEPEGQPQMRVTITPAQIIALFDS